MRVSNEYSFSEGQKQAIAEIDRKIFELQLQKAAILSVTPLKCKIELDRDDEIDGRINWERFNLLFGQPLIREGVVKIVPYDPKESKVLSEMDDILKSNEESED